MFEIRCESPEEISALRHLAHKVNAYLEVCAQEQETVWYVLTELPEEPTPDTIEQMIRAITSAYERID